MFMCFGLGGRVHDSQDTQQKSRKPNHCKTYYSRNIEIPELHVSNMLENPEDMFARILQTLVFDQYLSENHEMEFLRLSHIETLKLIGTLELYFSIFN